MLTRIESRRYVFTVSGSWGALDVFNASGRKVAEGLGTVGDAEAWCERKTRDFPEKPLPVAHESPGVGRSSTTGY